ncbi:MAG: response regulator transcription factor [Actinobacteria bacterium]|nr:response regulator transcription factor [Actinomycetota bacterium]
MLGYEAAICRTLVLLDEDDVVVAGVGALLAAANGGPRVTGVDLDDLVHVAPSPGTVVLYDALSRGAHGVDTLRGIVGRVGAPVAVFSLDSSVDGVVECLRVGARGFVSKSTDGPLLARHLQLLAAGRCTIDPAVAGELAEWVVANPTETWAGRADGLSRREGEVMKLLARGLSNREIADLLIIGLETVKTHAHAIYRKLGARNRVDVIARSKEESSTTG